MNQVTRPAAGPSTPSVSKLPLRQVQSVREMLMNDMAKQQLASVSAKHMNPDRMMRLMANAIRTTPKLGDCNPLSLLGAMMQCASLGLEPNTVLGHAYLIPFDRKERQPNGRWEVVETNVQLIIGYQGFIALGWRSGMIESFDADVRYSDCPVWEYRKGINATLEHEPGNRQGEPLHAYAICKIKGGGVVYVVLPWAEVVKVRDGSQGWQSAKRSAEQYKKPINSPWSTHEYAMARKTAIRALAKFMPMSTDFADAYAVDGAQQADFAAFAMNHNEGLAIADQGADDSGYSDAEHVDPETGEVGGDPGIEDQRATQTVMEPERNKAPVERQARAKADEKPAARKQTRNDQQNGLNLAPSLSDRIKMLDESIKDMLAEGTPLDEALEMFEAQLDSIKAEDADEHAAMIEEYESIVANRA